MNMRALFAITVLALAGTTAVYSADKADPAVGTWELNVSKSKFSPGPAPKSLTRVYKETADGTSLAVTGVAADGSPVSMQSTFKYDGKDYAFTGAPGWDTLAIKRVNGTTVKSTLKKGGKVVGSSTRSISEHGKVMTLTTKATDSKGVQHEDTQVFEKK